MKKKNEMNQTEERIEGIQIQEERNNTERSRFLNECFLLKASCITVSSPGKERPRLVRWNGG